VRVTNRMLSDTILTNLNRNLQRMNKMQDQMSSGRLVRRPSDDPIGMAQILSFKSVLAEQAQHVRNMEDGIGWIDTSEDALSGATTVLQRARELAVYGGSGTIPQDSRNALAMEVNQLIDELVQVGNTAFGGRYVFGGSHTTEPPFKRVGDMVEYRGNEQAMNWEVAPGVTVAVNADGASVFAVAGGQSAVFQVLFELKAALESGNTAQLSGDLLQKLDQYGDHILNHRATLGAKSNRLRLALDRVSQAEVLAVDILSKMEDVDLPKAVMLFKNQEYAYQAALATGARIIQPSLIDFLR